MTDNTAQVSPEMEIAAILDEVIFARPHPSMPMQFSIHGIQEAAKLVASKLSQGAAPVQGWVSCDERLPDESGHVLIFTEAHSVYVAHYKKSRNLFIAYGIESQEITDIKTTHWRPLPLPPADLLITGHLVEPAPPGSAVSNISEEELVEEAQKYASNLFKFDWEDKEWKIAGASYLAGALRKGKTDKL